jgi:translation initiation factor 4B
MRPDPPAAKSPVPSRDGSEAPSSPALGSATLPVGRPKLNLAKRTVSEATDLPSPASVSGDAKASPFGAARPIDTAAKEREIEEKRLAAIREKREAEDKAKEEKREAAKAAKAADAEKEAAEGDNADTEDEDASKGEETIEKENQNGNIVEDKAVKPKEIVRDMKPRPSDTGAWRRASGGPPPPRDDIPRGPRGGGRGRGRGEGRGGRHFDDSRPPRQSMNGGASPAAPAPQSPAVEPEAAALEADGWSTVSKPKKNNRGGNQASRAIAS